MSSSLSRFSGWRSQSLSLGEGLADWPALGMAPALMVRWIEGGAGFSNKRKQGDCRLGVEYSRAQGSRMTPERYPSFTASSAVAGVASGLRILRGLGYPTDSGRRNSCSPTFTRGRTHAGAGHAAGRGMRWKLSCATQVQRAARRFNMSGSRIQLPHAADFLVHSFECGSEHLFALQGMLSCAGKASASRCPFSARGPTILARQRASLSRISRRRWRNALRSSSLTS